MIILKESKTVKERLQSKREQLIHQNEKLEQMKCTIQNTEEEMKQLEYLQSEMEHLEKANREAREIAYDKVRDAFACFSRMFDYLHRRLHQTFKYKLACEVICSRYKFRSRSHSPGQKYLSFATVLAYFKRERGMVNA